MSFPGKTTCASAMLLGALVLVVTTSTLSANQLSLKKGTPIKLILATPLSSAGAKIGDPVEFRTAEDVKIGNVVVLPAGSQGRGFVANVESGKLFGAGKLDVYIGTVTAPSGLRIPVYGSCEAATTNGEAVLTEGTAATAEVDLDIPFDSGSVTAASDVQKTDASDPAKTPPGQM